MLEIKSLTKSYGDFSVSLDLHAAPGETLTLVGPSGSGKTTALNLAAGLAEPDSGSILLDGRNITKLPPWKRNISVVFQDLALFPHLDVGGNVAYGLVIRKIPKRERMRIVTETLEQVRLSGYASRKIHTLSGGERQRVAIARALASSPEVLLLDEPFSSLDAPLRKILRREFLEIRSSSRIPCIFVTHDREEAMMLGNRVALMKEGRIVETGPGKELLLAPKTEAAARFFGAGRILPCEILGKNENGVEVSSPLGRLTILPGSEYDEKSPLLFIPADAVLTGKEGAGAEWKPFRGKYTGSLFEGTGLTLNLLLSPRGKGQANGENTYENDFSIPFELSVNPRMNPPSPGSVMELLVNQNLVRFVKSSS